MTKFLNNIGFQNYLLRFHKPQCNLWGKSAATEWVREGGRSSSPPLCIFPGFQLSIFPLRYDLSTNSARRRSSSSGPPPSEMRQPTSCLHRSKSAITLSISFCLQMEVDNLSISFFATWNGRPQIGALGNPDISEMLPLLITNIGAPCLWWNTCACISPTLFFPCLLGRRIFPNFPDLLLFYGKRETETATLNMLPLSCIDVVELKIWKQIPKYTLN